MAVTAVAPVAWGSTYVVTRGALPADAPVWGAAFRALPAGLLLLLLVRRLPAGAWWWRSVVLGALNVGGFFVLVYVAAVRLPSSVAAVVMAVAPLVMSGVAWLVDGERMRARTAAAAAGGVVGVVLVVGGASGAVDAPGLVASATALLSSSVGFVLARRWGRVDPVPVVASTAWQLVTGGVALVVAALVVEGAPARPTLGEGTAFAYVSLVATALAFVCWFSGLARLDVTTVGVVGLLNPVTGVLLGAAVAAERVTVAQGLGVAVVLGAVLLAVAAPRDPVAVRAEAVTTGPGTAPEPGPPSPARPLATSRGETGSSGTVAGS